MGALNLTLTDKGERRLLYSALGRFNRYYHDEKYYEYMKYFGALKLRLFSNDVTAGKATKAGDLTEATITGYSEIDITPLDFVRKTADSDTTNTVYSKEYTFDFTGSGDIYGAYVCEADARAGVANVDTITCEADVAGSLDGKYFYISGHKKRYAVWYSVDGSGAAPNPSEMDGVFEVAITAGATATAIATATVSAINTGVNNEDILAAESDGAVITITAGLEIALNNIAEDEDSGFSFDNTPGVAKFFSGTHELNKITTTVGTSLGGKYFGFTALANTSMGAVSLYVWFDTGSSTDPEPEGYIAELQARVSVSTSDTAAQIATKIADAIHSLPSAFTDLGAMPLVADGDAVYLENYLPGSVIPIDAGDSGFTVTQLVDSSDTGTIWFAGNFPSALDVVSGDDIKITLQLTLN